MMQNIFFTLAVEGANQRTLYLANAIGSPSWTFNPGEAIRYDRIEEAEYRMKSINASEPDSVPQPMAVVRITMTIVTEAVS